MQGLMQIHSALAIIDILLINLILVYSYFIGKEIKKHGAKPYCLIIGNIMLFFAGISLFVLSQEFLKRSIFAFLIDILLLLSAAAWFYFHKFATDTLFIKKKLSPQIIFFYIISSLLYMAYYFILTFTPLFKIPFPISLLALTTIFIILGAVFVRAYPIFFRKGILNAVTLSATSYLLAFIFSIIALYYFPELSTIFILASIFTFLGFYCLWYAYPELLAPEEVCFVFQDWALMHYAANYLQDKKKNIQLLRRIKEDTSRYYGRETPISRKDYLMLEDAIAKEGKYSRVELRGKLRKKIHPRALSKELADLFADELDRNVIYVETLLNKILEYSPAFLIPALKNFIEKESKKMKMLHNPDV